MVIALALEAARQLPGILLLLGRQLEQGMEQLPKRFHIAAFYPESHSIDVYFLASKLIRPIRIELPIVNNMYPEGDELNSYILSFEPMENVIKNNNDNISNVDYIKNLIREKHKLSSTEMLLRKSAIQKRNSLLYLSDWTQLPDVQETFDAEEKVRWAEYRQKLRDITSQSKWPLDIDWPKQPFVFGVTSYE
jgi:hypothetical protein